MFSDMNLAQWAGTLFLVCGPWFWPFAIIFFWISWREGLKK